MPLPEKKESWVAKMFKAIGGRPTPPPWTWPAEGWMSASSSMLEALEQSAQQLEKLRTGLKQTDDPDLKMIADEALDDVLGDHPKQIRALLVQAGQSDQEAAPDALHEVEKAIKALGLMLEKSEMVEEVDENPFDVRVTLRETLGGASAILTRETADALEHLT